MYLSSLSTRLSFGWIVAKGTTIIKRVSTKNPLSSVVSEMNYGAAFWSRCANLWQELQTAVKPVLVAQARALCVNSMLLSLSVMLLGILTSQSWAAAAMVHLASMIVIIALPSLVTAAIRGVHWDFVYFLPLENHSVKDRGHGLRVPELVNFLHSEWDVELCAGCSDCLLLYISFSFMNMCICKCMAFKSYLLVFVMYYIWYQVLPLWLLFLSTASFFYSFTIDAFLGGAGDLEHLRQGHYP